MHIMETFVNAVEFTVMGDVLVNFDLALEIILHQTRDLSAALDTTEGCSAPYTAGHKLESARKRSAL